VNGNDLIGGLIGTNDVSDSITNCYALGSATGGGIYKGGLAGHDGGSTITSSYYSGTPNNGIGNFERFRR